MDLLVSCQIRVLVIENLRTYLSELMMAAINQSGDSMNRAAAFVFPRSRGQDSEAWYMSEMTYTLRSPKIK